MDKNTIWAIALSTLVLVGFMFVQNMFFPPVPPAGSAQGSAAGTEQHLAEKEPAASEKTADKQLSADVFTKEQEDDFLTEQEYTIETNVLRVRFTNRGGDIISYELLKHLEGSSGVELAKNITAANRAFSLSLGSNTNPIINDLFNVKIIDDYTIGFFKKFTLNNDTNDFTLVKQYSFDPNEYLFKLDITIDGTVLGGSTYTLRSSPQIGPYYNPKLDRYENRTFIFFTNDKLKKERLSAGKIKLYDKDFVWAGVSGKYFTQQIVPSDLSVIANVSYSTLNEVNGFQDAQVLLARKPVNQAFVQDSYYVYMGPKVEKNMRIYNHKTENKWNISGLRLDESLGSEWLSWLEAILKFLMEFFYKLIPNWGISIILMTILLKVAMFPLTKKSSVSSLKMQELQPRMKELQDKYKGSPEKLNAEIAKLYKEGGYNPVSGCLPLLIQMPLIFAMFNLFNNYFEFRGAMFIPGWIPDLSVGDSVFIFSANVPFVGGMPLRLLPIIYVGSQLLFTKITQGASGAAAGGSSMKIMMYAMPIMFFFMFYSAPAGLLLYWTVSNFLQLIQQLIINRTMQEKREEMGLTEPDVLQKRVPAKKKK